MDGLELRPATSGDLAGLAASSAALFAEDGAARDRLRDPTWPAAHGTQWCAGLLDAPDALVLVAVDGGRVVGHLIGSVAAASAMWLAPTAELVSAFVDPPWRGRSVGSRLVAGFLDWARERGAARVTVSAYAANAAAIGFYRRHGFEPLSVELARAP